MLQSINSFARFASDRSEVVGASFVLLMITMMVLPMSPMMLDVLIALNICATVVLVLSAVLLDSPLSFSSFPAVLLMTTLFRLSLTISTTRQILLEANAGEIIQTFGEFVVGGNVAVGLVIFLIISVVNFLVVTKGSERVAEVAARFSLDSMPGKQMSIDGDMRNGMLTQTQAKVKRSELEKESQLFGAMDGAIKFVKNDAIAGLVITVINLVGGLTVGIVQHDMAFGQAANIYTILSVGDGLVAIIPSLMTSVAAGLIVTRVTKGQSDGANTAQDIIRELTSNNKAIQISGVFLLLFAFVPGMPAPVFILAGGALLVRAFMMNGPEPEPEPVDAADKFERMLHDLELKKGNKVVDDVLDSEIFNPLEVRFPAPIEMDPNTKSLLFSVVKFTRNQVIERLGVVLPVCQFLEDEKLTEISVMIYGVPLLQLPLGDKRLHVVAKSEDELAPVMGDLTLEFDPNLGRYSYFCEPTLKPVLDEHEIRYFTYEKRWAQMLEMLFVAKIRDFFTLNESQKYLARLNESHGEMIKELARIMPAGKIAECYQALLVENVSIRNATLIISTILEWGQRERDSIVISEQIRRELFEQICHSLGHKNTLQVVSLDNELEQFVRENLRSDGKSVFLDVDSQSINSIIEMVSIQFKDWAHLERMPVIVCSMDVRPHVHRLLKDRLKPISVLSYQEVSPRMELDLLGAIRYDESLLSSRDGSEVQDK